MGNQAPTRATIKMVFVILLLGSAVMALIGTFLPAMVDLDDETAGLMRIVFYGAAALSVGNAFWVKAKLTKQLPPEERSAERKSSGTVQRQ
ncbi:MAG TPA: hypothetical protein VJV39_01740 [Dongiaceae bacterium]|nr:hypothetical protein [Dongiaceae bacterium]